MICIKGLEKSFGDLQVLKGIDLEIAEGEVIAIIGPSGTGKSTLLRCMNFLEIPNKGFIRIGEVEVNAENFHKRDVYHLRKQSAMIFQNFCLFSNKTILDNVALALEVVQKVRKIDARREAMRILDQVGLSAKAESYPSTLSGGQQQRVAIGRAMALKPKVLLFDEPTSALDPYLVGEVLGVIKDIVRKHNTTMVIVTHEMRFAREVADRIIYMDNGGIVEEGAPEQLFTSPQKEQTRKFLAYCNSEKNQDMDKR